MQCVYGLYGFDRPACKWLFMPVVVDAEISSQVRSVVTEAELICFVTLEQLGVQTIRVEDMCSVS